MTQPAQPNAHQPTLFEQPLTSRIEHVPVSSIKPPNTKTIKRSVAQLGILQPVLLKPSNDPNYVYEVVDGARRTNSAIHFNFSTIQALITDGTTPQIAAARLTANVDRSDNPMPETRALQTIMQSGMYADVNSIASEMNLPKNKLKNLMKLALLPDDVLRAVEEGKMPIGVARQITKLSQEYQKLAITAFREKQALDEPFTHDDIKNVRIRRTGDLSNTLSNALQSLPSLTPLLQIAPLDLLAQEVQRLAHDRQIDLRELVNKLSAMTTSMVTPPTLTAPQTAHKAPSPPATPPAPAPASATPTQGHSAPISATPSAPKDVEVLENPFDFSTIPGYNDETTPATHHATPPTNAEISTEPEGQLPAAFLNPPAPKAAESRLKTTVPRAR